MRWSYGLTTVPKRKDTPLPRTLASLARAGFDSPRLFVDGADNTCYTVGANYAYTFHNPRVFAYANWLLGLLELYLRDPTADRFAMFQDDFVTYRNLREYLERSPYPVKSYLNLYTFPMNQRLAPPDPTKEHSQKIGWFPANQLGRGAVALVFDRLAVQNLLSQQHTIMRVMDAQRGIRAIDGGVITAMKNAGFMEYCHNPSLVQHTGDQSVIGNAPHEKANSFQGEDFDALTLLKSE